MHEKYSAFFEIRMRMLPHALIYMYIIRNASPSFLTSTLVATPIMQNMKIEIAAAAMFFIKLSSLLLMDVVIGIALHASPSFIYSRTSVQQNSLSRTSQLAGCWLDSE